jgi:hypothetical protein
MKIHLTVLKLLQANKVMTVSTFLQVFILYMPESLLLCNVGRTACFVGIYESEIHALCLFSPNATDA